MLCLGIHVTKEGKVLDEKKSVPIHEAIERDMSKLGLNAVQIFTHGPKNLRKNNFDEIPIKKLSEIYDLTVHSAYATTGVWKLAKNPTNSEKNQKLGIIKNQLEIARDISAWGWVLHITKQKPEDVAKVMKMLLPIAHKNKIIILLEMVSSKADNKTYETPEKINHLTKLIGIKNKWWGWCVDTAHLWGAGQNIQTKKSMQEWLDGIDNPEKIMLFHLNGSSAVCGSGKDKHEIAFSIDDKIWKDIKPHKSGLATVVEFATKKSIPMIMEINRGKQRATERAIDYIVQLAEPFEENEA